MNKPAAVAVIVILVVAAAGSGYWMGQRKIASLPGASGQQAGGKAGQGGDPVKGPVNGAAAQGGEAVTVEAAKVTLTALPQAIIAVGSLRSDESVTVRPEAAGRISEIGFKEGQRIAKGDMLLRLDPAVNDAEVLQARANLTLAKTKFDRAVDLAKSNFISGQARDEAENNLKVAQAALALSEAKRAKMEIRAPFSGIVGLRSVSVGDYVKEGADIVNLESIDPLKVDFRVPEVFLKQVRTGQPLEITLDALPGRSYAGRILAINPLVDAAGRSIVIRAQVANPDTTLRPGMFARVRLITGERQDAIVVPEQALVPFGSDQFVFRVVDGKAQRVRVDIGQRGDGRVEIRQGLGPEDTVIVAGQLKVRDGVPVVAAPPAGPAQAGGASGAAKDTASAPLSKAGAQADIKG